MFCILVDFESFQGTLFRKRFKEAAVMRVKHQELFSKFTTTFKPETTSKWEAACRAWDDEGDVPNPYQEPANSTFNKSKSLESC